MSPPTSRNIAKTVTGLTAPVRACSNTWTMKIGMRATMPAMMMSEMPLPTPRAVICSPSHIRKIVPPVSVITVEMRNAKPGRMTTVPHCSRPDGDRIGLNLGEHDRAVARVLVDLLAARLAFFLELLERRRDRRHQLDDDRGGDVGHDAEREDRHALDGAAGQEIEHVEQAALLLLDLLGERGRIDAGHRDIGAEPRDDQRHRREDRGAA